MSEVLEGFLFSPKPFYGQIKVKKNKIASLSSRKLPRRIETLILPGMVSTHIHTVQTHCRNHAENLELLDWLEKVIWPFEASLNARQTYASSWTGMNESLRFGITTILDMATTRHTREVFGAARDTGIRAIIGKALMDRGPRSLVEAKPLEEFEDLYQDFHGSNGGLLHVSLCPRFVLSCSDSLLRQVGRLSRERKILQHTHAAENKKECAWIQKHFGKSNIEILDEFGCLNPFTVMAHAVHLSARDLDILKRRGVKVSHCPTSNLKLASGIADIKRLQQAKVSLSLGVDGAPCNNLLDPFFEMRIAHLLSRSLHGLKGLSAKQIFEISTKGGAKALGLDKKIGSLEVGKEADVLVIKVPENIHFNPDYPYESLLHSIVARDIVKVLVAGRRVS